MTKGLPRSIKNNDAVVQARTVKIDSVSVTVDGASGVGFGSAVIGDFPEGNIVFYGAVSYLTLTGPTSGSLSDTWNGDYGIGTTPAGDATITAGDVDIIQSTAMGPATAEASPRTRGTHLAADVGEVHDNTDGSLELNLNVLVDDADISADGIVMTAVGELHLAYAVFGDD